MNGNEDGNKINRSNAAINVLPQRGEGGHTRDIDIEASPVTGAAELLLTQGSPGVGPFWHFQKRRTGRKYSPERSKMAGVSKSGVQTETKKVRFCLIHLKTCQLPLFGLFHK